MILIQIKYCKASSKTITRTKMLDSRWFECAFRLFLSFLE